MVLDTIEDSKTWYISIAVLAPFPLSTGVQLIDGLMDNSTEVYNLVEAQKRS
jgi:hypothetical protein